MATRDVSNNKFLDKWSAEILRRGFTEVPNCLIYCQQNLRIENSELKTLLNLCAYKFTAKDPYPSVAALARNAGQSTSTIRDHLRRLERKGLIRRIYITGSSSKYDLSPLIHRLENHNCNNPIRNMTRVFRNYDRQPYQESGTKKDYSRKQNNKTSSVGEILKNRNIKPP